jgi:hypothetical protein
MAGLFVLDKSSFSVTYVFRLLLAKSISALGNGISSY